MRGIMNPLHTLIVNPQPRGTPHIAPPAARCCPNALQIELLARERAIIALQSIGGEIRITCGWIGSPAVPAQ